MPVMLLCTQPERPLHLRTGSLVMENWLPLQFSILDRMIAQDAGYVEGRRMPSVLAGPPGLEIDTRLGELLLGFPGSYP